MRELTKEQIEQVAGAGAPSSYGSSWSDPSHSHHKHKKHHKHQDPHKHHTSYDPTPAPYAPPSYTPTTY